MKNFGFSPFGTQSLIIRFICIDCGQDVESENIKVPQPNYLADTANESTADNEGYATCMDCGHQYNINIYASYAGGDGQIDDLPVDHEIEIEEIPELYYEDQYDAISSNTLFHSTFKNEIENLRHLNEIVIENPSVDKTLRRQIFVGVIASMETYLSDAFINTTLKSEKFTKSFVSTFKDFKERSIRLSELFEYHNKIDIVCRQAMLDVLYHNLPKVKGMYKDTLDVDLGDIGIAHKAVQKRHDLVHRNGKSKEGTNLQLTKESIKKLLSDIENFITKIDNQINK